MAPKAEMQFIDEVSEGMTNEAREHTKVLQDILNDLTSVDFRDLANIDAGESVPQQAKIVIAVQEVLRTAKELNCGLCRNLDFTYAFNGEYWNAVNKDNLEYFLGEAAEKLGVEPVKARYHKFKTELLKQFIAEAHLPKPERTDDAVLINLKNGTYEINPKEASGLKLRGFNAKDFLTYQLPFAFDATDKCPKWQKFLDQVLPDADRGRQKILAEFIGYVFARNLNLEKCLILYGTGANGKSVVFNVVGALLGRDNISNISLEDLSKDQYYRATLVGKLLNYSSEISSRLQADKFKQLTSGEPITARLPYGQPMTLTEYARLAFNSNELPRDVEHTEAFFRRFLIIPFDVTVPESARNIDLAKEITAAELSGVFNWMLEGLNRLLRQRKFTDSSKVNAMLETFRRESDSVAMFLNDEGYWKSDRSTIYLKEMYAAYRTFCNDCGYRPVGLKTLSSRLTALTFLVDRGMQGMRVWVEK